MEESDSDKIKDLMDEIVDQYNRISLDNPKTTHAHIRVSTDRVQLFLEFLDQNTEESRLEEIIDILCK